MSGLEVICLNGNYKFSGASRDGNCAKGEEPQLYDCREAIITNRGVRGPLVSAVQDTGVDKLAPDGSRELLNSSYNTGNLKLPKCPGEKCQKFNGVNECVDCIRDENKADLFEPSSLVDDEE